MNMQYNQQPTLLIGLGGFGSRVTDNIYGRIKENYNVSAFSIDTDVYLFHSLKNISNRNFVSIAQQCSLGEYLNNIPSVREWFPKNQILFGKTLSEGAGQVRAVSRLAFEIALREGKFENLLNEAYKIAKECVDTNNRMRVSIITSLVGGTGSGIFIQTALLIRKYINEHFPTLNLKIQGEFIMPANFLFLFANPTIERRNMESNAYASLKELNAINEHFFSNAKPLKLNYDWNCIHTESDAFIEHLPYDYCFLYDRINHGHNFDGQYIEDAIMERLFSISSNKLNDSFVSNLRLDFKKRAGNLYGMFSTEHIPVNATLLDSEIFRSIINRVSSQNGKQILMISAPKKLNIDLMQLPQDTIYLEEINTSLTEVIITEFNFGIEITEIEKLKYSSGQYYLSYQRLVNDLPQVITPHLNTNWHQEIDDIGIQLSVNDEETSIPHTLHEIPDNSFIFISYSSQEIETANQIKHILETNGISCWMAPQSIPAGSDYASEIPKAIDKCKAFLLLLSRASQESNWVPKEVGLAIGKGKIIVPFQIDDATIGDAFNFYLTNSQRISAYNRMTEAYQELINRLKDILN